MKKRGYKGRNARLKRNGLISTKKKGCSLQIFGRNVTEANKGLLFGAYENSLTFALGWVFYKESETWEEFRKIILEKTGETQKPPRWARAQSWEVKLQEGKEGKKDMVIECGDMEFIVEAKRENFQKNDHKQVLKYLKEVKDSTNTRVILLSLYKPVEILENLAREMKEQELPDEPIWISWKEIYVRLKKACLKSNDELVQGFPGLIKEVLNMFTYDGEVMIRLHNTKTSGNENAQKAALACENTKCVYLCQSGTTMEPLFFAPWYAAKMGMGEGLKWMGRVIYRHEFQGETVDEVMKIAEKELDRHIKHMEEGKYKFPALLSTHRDTLLKKWRKALNESSHEKHEVIYFLGPPIRIECEEIKRTDKLHIKKDIPMNFSISFLTLLDLISEHGGKIGGVLEDW